MYTQVRMEGDKSALARLQAFYTGLPLAARNSFYPPSLALYLYELERINTTANRNGEPN